MALIIPSGSSTYGDSSVTEGGRYGKYVLAQFRSNANLDWVRETRAMLVRDELKYRDLKVARPRLRQHRTLWSRIENGVGQASVIVVDPEPYNLALIGEAGDGGVSLREIEDNPQFFDRAVTSMIAGSPIAFLPLQLAQAVPWGRFDLLANLESFTPEAIRKAIGGGLRNARVFAARAHALFDLTADSDATRTDEAFRSPLAHVILAELVSTVRSFDVEAPQTIGLLNEAANTIADSIQDYLPGEMATSQSPLVREVDSRALDEIQAADIAAGWAREMLEVGGPKSLGDKFERVWLNGRRIK